MCNALKGNTWYGNEYTRWKYTRMPDDRKNYISDGCWCFFFLFSSCLGLFSSLLGIVNLNLALLINFLDGSVLNSLNVSSSSLISILSVSSTSQHKIFSFIRWMKIIHSMINRIKQGEVRKEYTEYKISYDWVSTRMIMQAVYGNWLIFDWVNSWEAFEKGLRGDMNTSLCSLIPSIMPSIQWNIALLDIQIDKLRE